MGRRLLVGVVVALVVLGSVASSAAGADPLPAPPTSAATLDTTVPTTPAATPGGIQVGPTVPTPGATPGPVAPSANGGTDHPGVFDIGGRIRQAIDDWLRGLVTSALSPVLDLLGHSVLQSPSLTGPGRVRDLWGVAAVLANTLLVLIVLAGGALVMGHETVQTRWSAKEIAPRLVVAVIAANASLGIVGLGVSMANALSQAFLGAGVSPEGATATMRSLVLGPLNGAGIFLVLLGGVAAVLGVLLLAVYVIRVALLVVLTAGAPLALAGHGLPQTEGLARLWWRALGALLGVQVAQSLVLITATRVFFASDARAAVGLPTGGGLVDILVAACLLWVLVKIPVWAAGVVLGRHHGGSVVRVVRDVVVYKAAKAVAGVVAG